MVNKKHSKKEQSDDDSSDDDSKKISSIKSLDQGSSDDKSLDDKSSDDASSDDESSDDDSLDDDDSSDDDSKKISSKKSSNDTNSDDDNKSNKTAKLNVLDLFCGCGGMSQGLHKAGLNIVAGIDIWNKAIDSYKDNFDHLAICADLTKLSPEKFKSKYKIGKIDIIVGGPPCQGLSIAGKRDTKDPRNSLFMEFYKYLIYFKPKIFLMENVIGILSMKTTQGEKVIDIIMKKLTKNYNCTINKLYASDFNVPQRRRRTIIVGVRKDLKIIPPEITPNPKNKMIPVKTILLKYKDVDEKYFLSEKALSGIKAKKEKMKNKGHGFGAQFLKMDSPSYTIPARYWKDGYDALVRYNDDEIRRLTILELKRIQTFPDDYVLNGSNKEIIMQIGNAVACEFAYNLGKYLINLIK